jgi:dienelactone hydrolase
VGDRPGLGAALVPARSVAAPLVAFIAAGTSIRAELFRATTDSAAGRAIVVLHGCGGFDTFDHRLADTLPREGISTLYVDYFAPTPPPGN